MISEKNYVIRAKCTELAPPFNMLDGNTPLNRIKTFYVHT